mgnify:CR=1 FL=1
MLVLVALILLAAYLFSSIVNTPSFAGLSSVLDMIKGGPGYPIDAPGGKVKGMYQNGSSVVLLNETTIYFYNTSGSEVYSELHRMSNPQVETSGNMLLNLTAAPRATQPTAQPPTTPSAVGTSPATAASPSPPKPTTHSPA